MAENIVSGTVATAAPTTTTSTSTPPPYPRITIQFCTQCKWMLRAAYYAQELLSTFSVSIGEVALQPSTGGTFIITIVHSFSSSSTGEDVTVRSSVLWDRKTDGGFPETKELKRRVRDVIEPGRNLGHVDRDHGAEKKIKEGKEEEGGDGAAQKSTDTAEEGQKEGCEDCK